MTIVILVAVFLAVTAAVAGVALLIGGQWREPAESRLHALVQRGRPEPSRLMKDDSWSSLSLGSGERRLEQIPWLSPGLCRFISQSGVVISPGRLLSISALLAATAAAVGLVAPLPWVSAPTAALLGAASPIAWLWFKRRLRLSRFESQLPDALDLLARSLRAGHSLSDGIRLIGEELSAPAGDEFTLCFEQQNLGVSWDTALDQLALRVPDPDLRFFVTAMVLQRETGGDTAELLDKISRLVRERFQLRGQVNALTGEGRLSGIVLLSLPVLLGIYMHFRNPEYMGTLFTDSLGQKMVAGAIAAQLAGAVVIKKLVDIKV